MGCAASTATAMPAAVPAPATVPSKQPTQGDVGGCNPKATKHEKEPVTSRGAVEEKHAEGRGSEQSEDKPGEVLLKASASELKEDALPEIESLSGEHRVAFCADAQEPATGHETKDAKPVEEEKQTEKNSQGDEVPYTSPVRLLLVDSFAKFTISVPCYENLPPDSYVDVPFENYEEECAKDAAVISWRWMRMKPPSQEAALDPEACPVPVPLVEYVTGKAREDGIKYLWLDWSCAPQYPEDLAATMREINRSGKYYATARGFYIWCFADRVTDESFQHSDYFYRYADARPPAPCDGEKGKREARGRKRKGENCAPAASAALSSFSLFQGMDAQRALAPRKHEGGPDHQGLCPLVSPRPLLKGLSARPNIQLGAIDG